MGIGEVSAVPANETRRAIFFDRDGVLNKSLVLDGKPHAPADTDELEIFPEARALLERLRACGFLLFVATNQPNVSRGSHSRENVEAIHGVLRESMPLDEIFVCFHRDEDNCNCRKPRPGLLLDAAEKYGLDLTRCYMVGDRWRDVEAGQNARCRTVWIDCGYAEKSPHGQDFRAENLTGAVEWIINQDKVGA